MLVTFLRTEEERATDIAAEMRVRDKVKRVEGHDVVILPACQAAAAQAER